MDKQKQDTSRSTASPARKLSPIPPFHAYHGETIEEPFSQMLGASANIFMEISTNYTG
jgi:hypothetical protein